MALADDSWFEAQYNARAAVPEHADIYAEYEARSRRTRLNRACYLDVAYGADATETLDIFPASGANRAKVEPNVTPGTAVGISPVTLRTLDEAVILGSNVSN